MSDLISKELVMLDLEASSKEEVIEKLAKKIEGEQRLHDIEGFITQVHNREETFSTSVGFNFAIPHGKCDSVKEAALAFARLKNEVQWSETETAKYVFLIGVSTDKAGDEHLKILGQLARKIMREEFRQQIEEAQSVEEVLTIISA